MTSKSWRMDWRERNADRVKKHQRSYYEKHRDRIKAKALARQARMRPTQALTESELDGLEIAGLDPVRSYDEIAAALGITKARVGQLIVSALRKLRKRFPELRALVAERRSVT